MNVKIKSRTRVLVANAIGNLKLSLTEETYDNQLAALQAAKAAIDSAIATQATANAVAKPAAASTKG
ncbi:hypothetical protein [Rhizobium phage RHph_X94]|nr:hypothetical protein EVB28_004 [Rhizobium phage RHph_TM23]QIG67234.1 hypothetical protein EVB36_004 [Rhizobium phage RHph_TM36]QIG67327.1 hypothetical protein EVB38_004 [Rhizobium phage RHph_TM3_3_5A]QIG67462.1 hypothetical protein EVB40_004 [Rhizobium phage RHph_TM3_3_14A]QIG67558.1 hypothetical protein EVB42_004 [Rhizobium phage RHph_TM1_10B]QIG67565.1 hypothetical protein EVB43_004 [Rhizobium phage RHph_TM3_3_4B]QIG67572.1 hypothetical protein EVB44_004 [Rhizobium phage RHph_TM3_3_5B]Q